MRIENTVSLHEGMKSTGRTQLEGVCSLQVVKTLSWSHVFHGEWFRFGALATVAAREASSVRWQMAEQSPLELVEVLASPKKRTFDR